LANPGSPGKAYENRGVCTVCLSDGLSPGETWSTNYEILVHWKQASVMIIMNLIVSCGFA